MERLQKVIANLGYTSRRNAEELIKQGKVKVNGEVIISNCGTERGDLEEIIRYYLKGGKKGFLLVG